MADVLKALIESGETPRVKSISALLDLMILDIVKEQLPIDTLLMIERILLGTSPCDIGLVLDIIRIVKENHETMHLHHPETLRRMNACKS